MSFEEIADLRLLPAAKAHVAELDWDVETDGYLRIPAPPNPDGVLHLMARRGLQPQLVSVLFDHFPARPLERALLAWDTLQGALLGRDDGELERRLQTELLPLKQMGAEGTVAIPRDRVAQLIEAVRPVGDPGPLLHDFESLPSLAALVALKSIRDQLDDKPEVVDAVLRHAKRLSLARLPSLALAFLQILYELFALDSALELMIEVGLDFARFDAIPALEGQDDVSLQRQAYALVRGKLVLDDPFDASIVLEVLSNVPAVRDSTDPSLALAKAELALAEQKQPDAASVQAIEGIAPPSSGWRYAVRVRDAVTMASTPARAPTLIELFIARFGNDARLWRGAARLAKVRADLLQLLSREVRYLSHDPEVWRALGSFANDGGAIHQEVQQRLTAQLARALADAAQERPMSFTWPEFATNQPLDSGRSWTARFDSYDQYRETCYYLVRLFDNDQWVAELMVEVGTEFAGDDWSSPQFTNELRNRIARVAATGKTNTSYAGYLTR